MSDKYTDNLWIVVLYLLLNHVQTSFTHYKYRLSPTWRGWGTSRNVRGTGDNFLCYLHYYFPHPRDTIGADSNQYCDEYCDSEKHLYVCKNRLQNRHFPFIWSTIPRAMWVIATIYFDPVLLNPCQCHTDKSIRFRLLHLPAA